MQRTQAQETGMSWKPLMSKAEAEEYTRDSYYQGQDFYHGTSAKSANCIMTTGAVWEQSSENGYGDGFYLSSVKQDAIDYASDKKDPVVLSTRIGSKNPKIFQNGTDFYEFFDEYEIPINESEAMFDSRLFINQGYDAIEIRGIQTLVIILNPQQVAVFSHERTT
jgi:hypothetical protein